MGKWKAVVGKKGSFELFDLSADVGEQRDIAAENPAVVRKIKAIMAACHTETPWTTWKYDGF